MELDETLTLAGPEGIDLDLRLAGIGSRSAAALIDLILQFIGAWLLTVLAGAFGSEDGGAGLAILGIGGFMLLFGYPTLMEAFAQGRTVGKMVLGIAVVRDDGSPVTFASAAIRNLVRIVDLLPGGYLVGLVAIFASRRNQRVGDLAAGTLVVRRGREQHVVGAPADWDPLWGRLPSELPAEYAHWDTSAVTADEIAAVRAFLTRRHQLDPMHRHQLADTLARTLMPKVAGIPLDGGPEPFLERIAYVRAFR